MDQRPKYHRKANPVENASFLSKATFFFVLPMFILSRRQHFSDLDVYELLPSFSAKLLGNKLQIEWDVEKTRNKPSFFRSVWKIFGPEYTFWALVLVVIDVTSMIVLPNLIGRIVAYFDSNGAVTNQEVVIYMALLLGFIYVRVFMTNSFHFSLKQVLLKAKIACAKIVYQKALKLNMCLAAKDIGGQAVTLITKDLAIFDLGMLILHELVAGIAKIIVMMFMIYNQIGVSSFIGATVLVSFIFLQALLGSKVIQYRRRAVTKTDKRTLLIQEILSTIKVIKMYTWELVYCKSVDEARRKEVQSILILNLLKKLSMALGLFNQKLSLYTCIVTFVALGNVITAEKAFTVSGCFASLGTVLNMSLSRSFATLAELKVSLTRIENYLLQEEVSHNKSVRLAGEEGATVEFYGVTVNYGKRAILKNLNLSIKPGITLITGAVGSGKSTLLRSILGDNETMGTIEANGQISYASQEPWLFPGTIKQNIIFNNIFNESRYENVLRICALQTDLDSFISGDETILSDKGLNLSHGQKVRINLARAIYKSADIYLLDDCLSSVDAQVGRHIFNECFKTFLENKICLLVSQLHPFINKVNEIVVLNSGSAECQGGLRNANTDMVNVSNQYASSISENVLKSVNDCDNHEELEENTALLKAREAVPTKSIYQEIGKTGSVNRDVYYKYVSAGGLKTLLTVIVVIFTKQAAETWSNYSVRSWVDSEQNLSQIRSIYNSHSTEYEQARLYRNTVLNQYSLAIFTTVLLIIVKSLAIYVFMHRASVLIHWRLVENIVKATMTYFNNKLAGNVVNRFTRDFHIVDELLASSIFETIEVTLMNISILVLVSVACTWLLIPSACFGLIFFIIIRLYIPSSRNIRRIEGSVRSPVIGHMQATFDGLTTIRAFRAQEVLNEEFDSYADIYNTTAYMHLAAVQALYFYLDMLLSSYTAAVVIVLYFFGDAVGAGAVGLAITQAITLSGLLEWCAFQWSELEMHMTSVERILEYTETETEDQSGSMSIQKVNTGKIAFMNVSLSYSQNSNLILKDVSFTIEHGEIVGIVGRTGAGKSTLITALFRLYPFDGTITVGNLDVNTVRLKDLRSRITIIPQNPTLFFGTIRSNLDPNFQYSDKELWNALEQVEMRSKIESLDLITTENSASYSTGEKQLLCLARAILQNNSIIVLDEATAYVDSHTEYLIQEIIKTKFTNCTIIVIAHRLHMLLDCNKIIVMESGRVVECDHPQNLLSNKECIFYGMVSEAGLLY